MNEITEYAKQTREVAEKLLTNTQKMKITNEETLTASLASIKLIKGSWKFLDTERKKATKPILEAKKIIDNWFKPVLTALKERETELKTMGVKYLESRKTAVEMEGANVVERWHAEITDKKLIPIEWLEPKMTELNKLAVATKGKSPILGVSFVKTTGMASTSK